LFGLRLVLLSHFLVDVVDSGFFFMKKKKGDGANKILHENSHLEINDNNNV
jgi:hypothetical protein